MDLASGWKIKIICDKTPAKAAPDSVELISMTDGTVGHFPAHCRFVPCITAQRKKHKCSLSAYRAFIGALQTRRTSRNRGFEIQPPLELQWAVP
jgi:hypothetical protein